MALLFVAACGGNDSSHGDQYFQQKQYQKAVDAYTEYIEYNPEDFKAIYNRGRSYEELKEYPKALQDYQKAFKIDEKSENVLMSLGRYYFRDQNYKDAAFYFDKITQINNRNATAQYLKGRAYHKAGETDKAMRAYNSAIDADKKYGEAYLYRGALKIYLKKQSSGCKDIQTAQSMGVADAQAASEKYCK